MPFFFRCFTFLFLICSSSGYAQVNITKSYKEANPLKAGAAIPAIEKLKIHEDYLRQAVAKYDIAQQFFGNLYLYTDNMDELNYTAAIRFLLAAENIARQADNLSWQGFVKLRTGWVASIVQNDSKKAINEYEMGARLSAQAKDSLCMALCFEQISAMYSGLKEYDSSQHYFNLAIPVLRTSATVSADAAYSNFSSLLIRQGKLDKALLYIDSAVQIAQKQKNKRKEMFFLNNRGVVLNELKRYDSAETLYKYCMAADEENKWMDNLMNDYEGLSANYSASGNYAAAYHYLQRYHFLKDSLSGVAVNLKVANIQAADKRALDALVAKNALQKRNWIIATCVLIFCFIKWLWFLQIRKVRKKQADTRANLEQLTRTLIEKNGLLADIEQRILVLQEKSLADDASLEQYLHDKEELLAQITETKEEPDSTAPSSEQDDFEKNIYNQRILTASDWSAFKIYFEKAYPGYLLRLRNAWPALTEAEERMFLFIKLKLTNKEAAAILGISADSVKKTRTRLRKRLLLEEKSDLDEFISKF